MGFQREVIKSKFLDPFLEIRKKESDKITSILDYCEKKIKPFAFEILFEEIIDYLVDDRASVILLNMKSKGIVPIEFMMELRDLKELQEKTEKTENLKKYIEIQVKIIHKFYENKNKIEILEDLKKPRNKLQLLY